MSTEVSEVDNSKIEHGFHCSDSEFLEKKVSKKYFTKTILKHGQGFLRPYLESACVVDISYGTNEKTEIVVEKDNLQNLKIPFGKCINLVLGSAETEAVRIVEKCLMTMRTGEESEFVIQNVTNLHSETDRHNHNFSVLLTITLHSFSETKPIWSLISQEKYQLALFHKEKGTHFFKQCEIESAFCQYSLAIVYLICITEISMVVDAKLSSETKSQREIYKSLKCICYLNLAMCQMKVANYNGVINNCTQALLLDNMNVKGLYRRAQAYLACQRLDEARSDLKKALKIEPKNSAVSSLLYSCKQ
uniref:Uncharacterized protein n=1 Tax=Arion vulgaris TaxID=1028688 RepID=A0A0B6ZPD7_9EUPU